MNNYNVSANTYIVILQCFETVYTLLLNNFLSFDSHLFMHIFHAEGKVIL